MGCCRRHSAGLGLVANLALPAAQGAAAGQQHSKVLVRSQPCLDDAHGHARLAKPEEGCSIWAPVVLSKRLAALG